MLPSLCPQGLCQARPCSNTRQTHVNLHVTQTLNRQRVTSDLWLCTHTCGYIQTTWSTTHVLSCCFGEGL